MPDEPEVNAVASLLKTLFVVTVAAGAFFAALMWSDLRLAVPLLLGVLACGLLPFYRSQSSLPTGVSRHDVIWVLVSFLASGVVFLCGLAAGIERHWGAAFDASFIRDRAFEGFVAAAIITPLVVALPSRLMMNLVLASRRTAYRRETAAIAIAIASLCWSLYLLATSGLEG